MGTVSSKFNNLFNILQKYICAGLVLIDPGGGGGGRVVPRCWVNFQCQGGLLIWSRVGQGPTALAVGAGGGCLEFFFLLVYHFSFLSPSVWETV